MRHHLDTVLHRAGDLAQVAAHAFIVDYFVTVCAVSLLQTGNRLVRGVFTGNMAASATNTGVLVDLGDNLIIDIQIFPVSGIAYSTAGEIIQAGIALTVHPA